MIIFLVSFFCGLLMGIGLIISGMANPDKIMNFLDLLGNWDPSLALVMAGAVCITLIAFPVILNRQSPLLADTFNLPTISIIDRSLVYGAALFGLGWGLAGFCPGPALTQFGVSLIEGQLLDPALFLLGLIGTSASMNLLNRFSPDDAI